MRRPYKGCEANEGVLANEREQSRGEYKPEYRQPNDRLLRLALALQEVIRMLRMRNAILSE
jgi:hypothetical protein